MSSTNVARTTSAACSVLQGDSQHCTLSRNYSQQCIPSVLVHTSERIPELFTTAAMQSSRTISRDMKSLSCSGYSVLCSSLRLISLSSSASKVFRNSLCFHTFHHKSINAVLIMHPLFSHLRFSENTVNVKLARQPGQLRNKRMHSSVRQSIFAQCLEYSQKKSLRTFPSQ